MRTDVNRRQGRIRAIILGVLISVVMALLLLPLFRRRHERVYGNKPRFRGVVSRSAAVGDDNEMDGDG